MQLLMGMNGIAATGHELVETKGRRACRERSFLAGERQFLRTHNRGPKPSDVWSSYRTGSLRRTPQPMSTFTEESW